MAADPDDDRKAEGLGPLDRGPYLLDAPLADGVRPEIQLKAFDVSNAHGDELVERIGAARYQLSQSSSSFITNPMVLDDQVAQSPLFLPHGPCFPQRFTKSLMPSSPTAPLLA